jgi:hypothetical protein
MDFVASRADEQKFGWRNRVSEFLKRLGVTVFDPWFKPEVRGFYEYGLESEKSTEGRNRWSYAPGKKGAEARASCSGTYWPTLHIDLRMVDTSDFVICYCPTNIYSVGTPHEIILARQQRKPVLFVSPYVDFPTLGLLRKHLEVRDPKGLKLLRDLEPHQAQSYGNSQFVVHASGSEREFFRWLWFPPVSETIRLARDPVGQERGASPAETSAAAVSRETGSQATEKVGSPAA